MATMFVRAVVILLFASSCRGPEVTATQPAPGSSIHAPTAADAQCPSGDYLEAVHALFYEIENGTTAEIVEIAVVTLRGLRGTAWPDFHRRVESMAAVYSEDSEGARIDEAALRAELQESPCFGEALHRRFHQRL